MYSRRRGRELALKLLYGLDVLPRDVDATLEEFWSMTRYPQAVREFATQLVRGTWLHKDEIDQFISKNSINWSLDRMAIVDRNILRCAVYELLYEEVIPPKVTINEALDISKKYSTPKSSAFINGILDHIHHTLTPHKPSRPPASPKSRKSSKPRNPRSRSKKNRHDSDPA
ncbi:transcription antitermination factor NusB [candidate division KSB3 bacterium]|uniref:Transcription antitermination protein NusB n=1 Tax=candidate division KSB3 bacterium TaxID=2044937 RepID=A0A9D5JVY9_9BACT|nr:transcription antitermination factor NusB [candidate division KSB3 bacterium]MBD3324937.1 transcription antitermination factor NusB [candidate division KSB3 bacterium]